MSGDVHMPHGRAAPEVVPKCTTPGNSQAVPPRRRPMVTPAAAAAEFPRRANCPPGPGYIPANAVRCWTRCDSNQEAQTVAFQRGQDQRPAPLLDMHAAGP